MEILVSYVHTEEPQEKYILRASFFFLGIFKCFLVCCRFEEITKLNSTYLTCTPYSVVCFLFNPSSRISPQDEFSYLIVNKNQNRKRNGWKPPIELQGVHAQTLVHAWSVAKKSCKGSLKAKSKIKHVIS